MGLPAVIRVVRRVATAWCHVAAWQPRWPALARLRQPDGLTLVELVVDASILAILALAALLTTHNYLEAGRARTGADQVLGALQQARQYAISNAATYTVTLTPTTVAVTCTAGCPPNAPGETATPIMSQATASVPSPPITFDAMGAATAGTVTITYPGATQWQVRVSAAGRVRACSPTCS
jgi:Tfp pilus assembly protein FimT